MDMELGTYQVREYTVRLLSYDTDYFAYDLTKDGKLVTRDVGFMRAKDAFDTAVAVVNIQKQERILDAFIQSYDVVPNIRDALTYCHTEDTCIAPINWLFPSWKYEYWRMISWQIIIKEHEIVASITIVRR